MHLLWYWAIRNKVSIQWKIVGKQYTITPVTQIDETVPIPIASTVHMEEAESDHDDLEDESRLWCYCEQPSFGQMCSRFM